MKHRCALAQAISDQRKAAAIDAFSTIGALVNGDADRVLPSTLNVSFYLGVGISGSTRRSSFAFVRHVPDRHRLGPTVSSVLSADWRRA
jgi:hypothetical protein